MTPTVLSIQSHVAFGHVGNSAATFPMQRLGVEVWPVNTVQFSNHTGYGRWKGEITSGKTIDDIIDGIADLGVFERCGAILSGYMGAVEIGHRILDAAGRIRKVNADAIYLCDPVIGDAGRGVFVASGVGEFIKAQAVPAARIVTPNQFELDYLVGHATRAKRDLERALQQLHRLGPEIILVTSYLGEDTPADALDVLVSTPESRWRVRTPRLAIEVNGAGDAIAAVFLVHFMRSRSAAEALQRAASSIFGLLRVTSEAKSRELLLVAAQDEFVRPSRVFAVERV